MKIGRRGFFGFLGGAVVSAPSIAKAATITQPAITPFADSAAVATHLDAGMIKAIEERSARHGPRFEFTADRMIWRDSSGTVIADTAWGPNGKAPEVSPEG